MGDLLLHVRYLSSSLLTFPTVHCSMMQAFTNKNYPVESNQAKWISELVDFHVDTIMNSEVRRAASIRISYICILSSLLFLLSLPSSFPPIYH